MSLFLVFRNIASPDHQRFAGTVVAHSSPNRQSAVRVLTYLAFAAGFRSLPPILQPYNLVLIAQQVEATLGRRTVDEYSQQLRHLQQNGLYKFRQFSCTLCCHCVVGAPLTYPTFFQDFCRDSTLPVCNVSCRTKGTERVQTRISTGFADW